eukprot:XP_001706187.1 Hypothetical protein GL50803_6882 [Giardia lamblia ATCC 50803]
MSYSVGCQCVSFYLLTDLCPCINQLVYMIATTAQELQQAKVSSWLSRDILYFSILV